MVGGEDGVQIQDKIGGSVRAGFIFGVAAPAPLHRQVLLPHSPLQRPLRFPQRFRWNTTTGTLHSFPIPSGSNIDFRVLNLVLQRIPSRKLWAAVKPLQSLQPYANPRGSNYPGLLTHSLLLLISLHSLNHSFIHFSLQLPLMTITTLASSTLRYSVVSPG